MPAGGIVLCGGKSTRMGSPKALLPFGPERMLQRVVRLLGQVVRPIVVVAATGQQLPELPGGVLVARDQREARGPLEGLCAGLVVLQGSVDRAYATGCDVPLLQPAFVARMIELAAGHDVAVPVEGEFHHPLAAVYSTRLVGTIKELLDADRLRPVFLYEQANTLRVGCDRLTDVDARLDSLVNLNQPADYLTALERAGFAAPAEVLRAFGEQA